MLGKNRVEVKICGRDFTLMGTESIDYLKKVAAYLDRKMAEVTKVNNKLGIEATSVLTAVNVADDLFKMHENEYKLKSELDKLNEEINVLKEANIKLYNENNDIKRIYRELHNESLNESKQGQASLNIETSDVKVLDLEDINKIKEENNSLKQENNNLKTEIVELKEEINEFLNELDTVTKPDIIKEN